MTSLKATNEKLINRTVSLAQRVISTTDFTARRLSPLVRERISRQEITETVYSMMLISRYGSSLVLNTRDAILEKYQQLLYLWLFHHIVQPSERILRSMLFFPNSETANPIPLIKDVELAVTLTENKCDIICFEGGGSYFRFNVLTPNHQFHSLHYQDKVEKTVKVPGGNCNAIGWDRFFVLLEDAMQKIKINQQNLGEFILHTKPIIAIGMAGMSSEVNRQKLQDYFIEKMQADKKHVLITTDADAYLAAIPAHGAVLVAGTGSSCMGLDSQREKIQTGGLGAHLSGDPGSAYAVGRQALLDCLTLMNKGNVWHEAKQSFIGKDDPLFAAFLQKAEEILKIPRSQFVAHLNREHADRIKIAELAPMIFEYVFEKNPPSLLAEKIIREAAKELAHQLGGAMDAIFKKDQRLQQSPFHVVLVGGMFENKHSNHFIQLIEQEVKRMFAGVRLHWEHEPAENYVGRMIQRATQHISPRQISRGR